MSTNGQKNRFLNAADTVARWTGQSREALVHEYSEAVLESEFPGPDCLEPDEVLTGDADLPSSRRAHVQTCEACQVLLIAAQPTDGNRNRFLDEVARARASEQSAHASPVPAEAIEHACQRDRDRVQRPSSRSIAGKVRSSVASWVERHLTRRD